VQIGETIRQGKGEIGGLEQKKSGIRKITKHVLGAPVPIRILGVLKVKKNLKKWGKKIPQGKKGKEKIHGSAPSSPRGNQREV